MISRWLIAATSLALYAWISPPFALLLLATASADWFILGKLEKTRSRSLLWFSVLMNFLPLVILKLVPLFGNAWVSFGQLLLPVGVSFYTFKAVSYAVDVYRGEPRVNDPSRYFLYVMFFPSLLAGPISRFGEFCPTQEPFSSRCPEAVRWLIHGAAKKLLISESFRIALEPRLLETGDFSPQLALAVMLSLTVQVYADFSAYTDIARGSALLLGYRLPSNFHFSLLSCSIGQFWQRHHMSLSHWLRDYIYLPLAAAGWPALSAAFFTYMLSGLWHGFTAGALVFGASQGAFGVLYHVLPFRSLPLILRRVLGWPLTLFSASFGMLFLLGPGVGWSWRVFCSLFRGISSGPSSTALWALLALFFVAHFLSYHGTKFTRWQSFEPAWLALLLSAAYLCSGQASPFVYFRF